MTVLIRGLKSNRLDQAGFMCSFLCIVHCSICFFFPTLFLAIGANILSSHNTEWFFTIITVGIASLAFLRSRKRFSSSRSNIYFICGIGLLIGSRFLELAVEHYTADESIAHFCSTLVGVVAGILIILGHTTNMLGLTRKNQLST